MLRSPFFKCADVQYTVRRGGVIPFVHAAPGEARRRHVRKELRVRKVIDLRSLFFHNHYSCSSQNNRVTVRIHTMAAAR